MAPGVVLLTIAAAAGHATPARRPTRLSAGGARNTKGASHSALRQTLEFRRIAPFQTFRLRRLSAQFWCTASASRAAWSAELEN